MIKILILLAVMALPQVGGLSTVCNAGGGLVAVPTKTGRAPYIRSAGPTPA